MYKRKYWRLRVNKDTVLNEAAKLLTARRNHKYKGFGCKNEIMLENLGNL